VRDWVTLLHPPYTAWHLSYVAIGAALAPHFVAWRLGGTLVAFFLAVGVGAHALDELAGRPLQTGIPAVALAIAAGALAELEFDKLPSARVGTARRYNMEWYEALEMRNLLLAARAMVLAAGERRESRGAHQRGDFIGTLPRFEVNSRVALRGTSLIHSWRPVVREPVEVPA